jgi:hypothetical protein
LLLSCLSFAAAGDFKATTRPVPSLKEGEVLVKVEGLITNQNKERKKGKKIRWKYNEELRTDARCDLMFCRVLILFSSACGVCGGDHAIKDGTIPSASWPR